MTARIKEMTREATASKTVRFRYSLKVRAIKATKSPSNAAVSSNRTVKRAGSLLLRIALTQPRSPLDFLNSVAATQQVQPSIIIANPKTA